MREAFADYLAHNDRVEAIFVGTRRTDPHGGRLGSFQRTDGGWPGFMRVHPVIEWRYGEVWAVSFSFHQKQLFCPSEWMAEKEGEEGFLMFDERCWKKYTGKCVFGMKMANPWGLDAQFLKHLDIPYCELYDQGYTSLGGTTDTHPNPALKVVGSAGELSHRPAYELEDDDLERLGRDW